MHSGAWRNLDSNANSPLGMCLVHIAYRKAERTHSLTLLGFKTFVHLMPPQARNFVSFVFVLCLMYTKLPSVLFLIALRYCRTTAAPTATTATATTSTATAGATTAGTTTAPTTIAAIATAAAATSIVHGADISSTYSRNVVRSAASAVGGMI